MDALGVVAQLVEQGLSRSAHGCARKHGPLCRSTRRRQNGRRDLAREPQVEVKAAILAVLLFLLPASGRACAQSGGASPVTVQWDNGLTVTANGGASELQLGGVIPADGRLAPRDPLHHVPDEFLLPRVRFVSPGPGA